MTHLPRLGLSPLWLMCAGTVCSLHMDHAYMHARVCLWACRATLCESIPCIIYSLRQSVCFFASHLHVSWYFVCVIPFSPPQKEDSVSLQLVSSVFFFLNFPTGCTEEHPSLLVSVFPWFSFPWWRNRGFEETSWSQPFVDTFAVSSLPLNWLMV